MIGEDDATVLYINHEGILMGRILDFTDVDMYGFWEDMAYHTEPLIGPDLYRRFALPRYKRVVDYVRSRGVPHVCLDSDGCISSLIPIWLDAGIDTLYPFEAQAGYVPGLDHSMPPDVSYANYLYYMRKLGEACGVPPAQRGGA